MCNSVPVPPCTHAFKCLLCPQESEYFWRSLAGSASGAKMRDVDTKGVSTHADRHQTIPIRPKMGSKLQRDFMKSTVWLGNTKFATSHKEEVKTQLDKTFGARLDSKHTAASPRGPQTTGGLFPRHRTREAAKHGGWHTEIKTQHTKQENKMRRQATCVGAGVPSDCLRAHHVPRMYTL